MIAIPPDSLNLSPEELASKAARWAAGRAKSLFEELWTRAGGQSVKGYHLPGIVSGAHVSSADAARYMLRGMSTVAEVENIDIAVAHERFPGEIAALIDAADRKCERKFRMLGEDVDYSGGIRWHYDPRNDHEFDPRAFHASIQHSAPEGGFDIKYPWEISRLQHIPKLALAFHLTGETRYADALRSQTMDWIDQNPVGFGVNWACTMDVSIRAANIAFAFSLTDAKLSDDDTVRLASSLIEHGRFIVNHLEWSEELTSNHYLADIAGLAVLSSFLAPAVPEVAGWLDFARSELENEIEKQVYPDGWDFEASTAYHRLALECFLIPAILLDCSDSPMSDEYRRKIGSMAAFVRDITLPDGSFPLIGDNDSGLFISLQPRDLSCMDYLLPLAATYINDCSLKPAELNPPPEILWLTGVGGLRRFDNLTAADRPSTAAFPDGGLRITRSDDSRDYLSFRLGQVGQNGNGGHAHNDQLSVTIWLGGKPIVADSGSAVYTSDPEKRNLYRSVRSHATVAFGDIEQNRFIEGNLFTLPQEVEPEFVSMETAGDETHIEGVLKGYGPWSSDELTIRRRITHNREKREFEIEDDVRITGRVNRKPVWSFPLAAGLDARESGSGHVRITDHDGKTVAEVLYYPGWKVEIDETHLSPEYGIELPNITLRFTSPGAEFNPKFIFRAPRTTSGIREF